MSLIHKVRKSRIWILGLVIILLLINWAASVWHTRIDLTNEKRFTLSAPTKKLLQNIQGTVTIDVFLKGSFPSGFRKLAGSTEDVLREFKEVAGNKLQYNFISPEDEVAPGITYGDTLSANGLYPLNLTSQLKEG